MQRYGHPKVLSSLKLSGRMHTANLTTDHLKVQDFHFFYAIFNFLEVKHIHFLFVSLWLKRQMSAEKS